MRCDPDLYRWVVVFLKRRPIQSIQELQSNRPLEFDSKEERRAYVDALSSRLAPNEMRTEDHALHGDRWGRSETPQ